MASVLTVMPVRSFVLLPHAAVGGLALQPAPVSAGNVSVPIVSPLDGGTPALQFAGFDHVADPAVPPPLQLSRPRRPCQEQRPARRAPSRLRLTIRRVAPGSNAHAAPRERRRWPLVVTTGARPTYRRRSAIATQPGCFPQHPLTIGRAPCPVRWSGGVWAPCCSCSARGWSHSQPHRTRLLPRGERTTIDAPVCASRHAAGAPGSVLAAIDQDSLVRLPRFAFWRSLYVPLCPAVSASIRSHPLQPFRRITRSRPAARGPPANPALVRRTW